jgi:ABC-2 type transport system permease protein
MTTAPARLEGRVQPWRGNVLTGTGTMLRFMLRRDRVRLPAWILGITAFMAAAASSLPDLYPEAADRQARATLMENPGTRAISGAGYGLDDYTFGAMISNEYLSWLALLVALMGIFAVVRHTRAEEETGRAELVRSNRVGRHATTTAALAVACGAGLALGGTLALALGSLGLESVDWGSSLLFGAALASVCVVFAGAAAVTVQLSQHARGAVGLAGAVFALAFVVRAAGNMTETGGGLLSWLSPVGWAQQTRAYVDDRWWPLLLPVALTVIVVAAAYWLSTRRDVGAGLMHARPGRADAPASLSSPLGLAWRLQRAGLAWWSASILVVAVLYGTLVTELEEAVAEMTAIQDALTDLGGTIIDAWLAVIINWVAIVVTVFAILAALRARSEENSGRAEPVLATAVSRSRWLGSHPLVALVGSAVLMTIMGTGFGLSLSVALDDSDMLWRVLGAALVHVPAIWLTVAIAMAVFGLASRATPLVWVVFAYAGVVGWLGTLLGFPQWAMNLSPLGHTPMLPAEDMQWIPLIVAAALAALLAVVGLAGFRRRDLQGTA